MSNLDDTVMGKARSKTVSRVKQMDFAVGSGRLRAKVVANIFLTWLDEDINDSSEYYQNSTFQLSQVANMFKIYTDRNQSVDFLTDIQNEDICLLICEEISQQVVPLIHDFDRLQYIFIVRRSQKQDEQWIKNWFKIKGIYADISTICDVIRQTSKQCQQNAASFNLLKTTDNLSENNLNQLDPMFMYSQILTQIILEIQFKEEHFKEFIGYCRQTSSNNDAELKNIEQFQRDYHTRTAVKWYTAERFLYTTLNRGLRIVDADTIIKMGCFITDLYRQIEQLHEDQYPKENPSDHFIVYRGQVIPKIEFEKIQKAVGGLIAFNSFLSTSKIREVSSVFSGGDQIDEESVGILFVIVVDPAKSSAAFASIKDISQYPEENEILFVMHAIFRINTIIPIPGYSRQFEVKMVLTNDTDQDLRMLKRYIQDEIPSSFTGWEKLAFTILTMGQRKKAQSIDTTQGTPVSTEDKKMLHYSQLAISHQEQGEYSIAIQYYEEVLAIQQQSLPSNHPDLANCYSSIGSICSSMRDYSKALVYREKALQIQQRSLPSNHPDLASFYNNIATVHSDMRNYSKALEYHEKALEMQQQFLPSNHPDLASSYNNIGTVYSHMDDYSKALVSYEKALAIQQQSLPSNHPDLGNSYNDISDVYCRLRDYSKALVYHEKALAIWHQSPSHNHSNLIISYKNIGDVYSDMANYSKALEYHEKALEMQQQSLPSNHPDLASSYNNIGSVCSEMDDYSKALESFEKALAIRQQSLPSNHPDLASSYNNIGSMYSYMNENSKALVYYEKALAIRQQSLPSNHPDLASSYNNIATLYSDTGDYSKALEYHEKALAIWHQSPSYNHSNLIISYKNIGDVYSDMGNYSKALISYEKALEMQQQSLSSNHPDLASSHNNIGSMYSYMHDYSKALVCYEKALAIRQQSLPSNHSDLASSYNKIATVYSNTGDYSKGRYFMKRALEIAELSLPADHSTVKTIRRNLEILNSVLS